VFGVTRTESLGKRLLFHIHTANKRCADWHENHHQSRPISQRQSEPDEARSTPVYDGCRTRRNGPRSTSSWSFWIVTSTVKNRPRVMIAHQRNTSPTTKIATATIANTRPNGSAAARQFTATNTPAAILTV